MSQFNSSEYIKTELPVAVNLLFNNLYLDLISILIIATAIKNKKSESKTREILFYYSLACTIDNNFEEVTINEKIDVNFFSSIYFRILRDINELFLFLYDLGLATYNFNEKKDLTSSTFIITEKGLNLVENLKSEFLKDFHQKSERIKKNIKFSVVNEQMFLGGSK